MPEVGKLYRSRSVPDHPLLLMVSVVPAAPGGVAWDDNQRCYATWLEDGKFHSTNIRLKFFWEEYEEVVCEAR